MYKMKDLTFKSHKLKCLEKQIGDKNQSIRMYVKIIRDFKTFKNDDSQTKPFCGPDLASRTSEHQL